MAICQSCGSEVQAAGRFCHACGAPTNVNQQSVGNSSPIIIRTISYTVNGVVVEFERISLNDVGQLLSRFFVQMGFRLESGNMIQATYGKGSAVARIAVGGFVTREKYSVAITQLGSVIRADLVSAMSGLGGGVIGRSKENTARNNFKQSFDLFLRSL